MKTIKSKGVEVETGKAVAIRGYLDPADSDSFGAWEIEPDSVKQLVGFDKNGNEVYEGEQILRPIKFKGETLAGTTITGDLIHVSKAVAIRGYLEPADSDSFGTWEVKPESVKQLVGFDKNGAELYAGDTILIDGGEMTIAEILPPHYLKFGELKKNDLQTMRKEIQARRQS